MSCSLRNTCRAEDSFRHGKKSAQVSLKTIACGLMNSCQSKQTLRVPRLRMMPNPVASLARRSGCGPKAEAHGSP